MATHTSILFFWREAQYSCLGNSMDEGDWRTAVHEVIKSRQLNSCTTDTKRRCWTQMRTDGWPCGHTERWRSTSQEGTGFRQTSAVMPQSPPATRAVKSKLLSRLSTPAPWPVVHRQGGLAQTDASIDSLDNIKLLYSNPTISIVYQLNTVKLNFPSITIWSPMRRISTGRTR